MKRYLNLAALAGIVALIIFAYCTGRSQGGVSVEDKQLKKQVDSLHRIADGWKKRADDERDSRVAEQKKFKQADSVIKDTRRSFIKATQKYEVLRDSVLKAPSHTETEAQLIASADSIKSAAISRQGADSVKIVLLESDTASKAREIFALRNVVSTREQELSALNRRLAISSKRIKNARRQGWLQGSAALAFGVVVYKASQ